MWWHTFLYRFITEKTHKEHLALIEFIGVVFCGLLKFRGYVNHIGTQPIVYTFIHIIGKCIYGLAKQSFGIVIHTQILVSRELDIVFKLFYQLV